MNINYIKDKRAKEFMKVNMIEIKELVSSVQEQIPDSYKCCGIGIKNQRVSLQVFRDSVELFNKEIENESDDKYFFFKPSIYKEKE